MNLSDSSANRKNSYLVTTMGSDVGVITIHRIRSQGQSELGEMTGTTRAKRLRVALRTAFRLGDR